MREGLIFLFFIVFFLRETPQDPIDHIIHQIPLEMFWHCFLWRAWTGCESRITTAMCQLTVPTWEFLQSVQFIRTRHFLGHAPKGSVSKRFAFACIPINCGCCCWQAIQYMGHKVFYCCMHWKGKHLKIRVRQMWLNVCTPQLNISLAQRRLLMEIHNPLNNHGY